MGPEDALEAFLETLEQVAGVYQWLQVEGCDLSGPYLPGEAQAKYRALE